MQQILNHTSKRSTSRIHRQKQYKERSCPFCNNIEAKLQELSFSYEHLLTSKEEEINNLTGVIDKYEKESSVHHSKIRNLTRKITAYEEENDILRKNEDEQQSIVNYFKKREAELLQKVKRLEDELYSKDIILKDEIEHKQDKIVNKIVRDSSSTSLRKSKQDKSRIDLMGVVSQIGSQEKTVKTLSRKMHQAERANQDKGFADLKYRMAVLRAAQFSILK